MIYAILAALFAATILAMALAISSERLGLATLTAACLTLTWLVAALAI